jgi:hypothetical protein
VTIPHHSVPWIRLAGGIAHAVAAQKGAWLGTSCGKWTPVTGLALDPDLKCAACVKALLEGVAYEEPTTKLGDASSKLVASSV